MQFFELKIKSAILLCILFSGFKGFAQLPQFSLATDFTIVRSFQKHQRYWTVGQTVAGNFHITARDAVYTLFAYTGNGKFTNQLEAPAKDAQTSPQQISFTNRASLNYKHISIGWKHYFVGDALSETGWNLYGQAGFGLMMGKVVNLQSASIDTLLYDNPVLPGKANFKRLTLDLALGYELPVGGGVAFYMEGRALVPTTDFPSKYLWVNNDAPFTGSVNLGIRLLFE